MNGPHRRRISRSPFSVHCVGKHFFLQCCKPANEIFLRTNHHVWAIITLLSWNQHCNASINLVSKLCSLLRRMFQQIGQEFCKIKTSSKNVRQANGARADCPEIFRVRRRRRLEAPGPLVLVLGICSAFYSSGTVKNQKSKMIVTKSRLFEWESKITRVLEIP